MWRYFCLLLKTAFRTTISHALNWAGIIGVGIVGAYSEYKGHKLMSSDNWQDIVISGVIYTVIAGFVIFLFRLIFVAPYSLWKEKEETIPLSKSEDRWGIPSLGKEEVQSISYHLRDIKLEQRISIFHNSYSEELRISLAAIFESIGWKFDFYQSSVTPIRSGVTIYPDNDTTRLIAKSIQEGTKDRVKVKIGTFQECRFTHMPGGDYPNDLVLGYTAIITIGKEAKV